MKKYLFLSISLLSLGCFAQPQETETPYSQRMVESLGMEDFYCNTSQHESLNTTPWDYVSGLVANAVLKAWQMYPEKQEYYDAVKAFADFSTNADGSDILNGKGTTALRPSNIDDLPAGNIFFALYQEELRKGNTQDAERYRNATNVIRNKLKYEHSRIAADLNRSVGILHKAS